MEIIVVNDTNIFIDLISIDLLNELFLLPIEVHTNDFVINELSDLDQKRKVTSFQQQKQLHVKTYSPQELAEIFRFQSEQTNNVSFTDCSVWLYAKQNSFCLLTGDGKLRSSAIASNTEVRGILFVFDKLVEEGILAPNEACTKLNELYTINRRLPSIEIKKRLEIWGKLYSD